MYLHSLQGNVTGNKHRHSLFDLNKYKSITRAAQKKGNMLQQLFQTNNHHICCMCNIMSLAQQEKKKFNNTQKHPLFVRNRIF